MGQLPRWLSLVVGLIVLVIGIAQFTGGLNALFGPAMLPDCDNGETTALVGDIIADNFQVTVDEFAEITEVAADETAQTRECTAVIATADGSYDIAYDLSWQDRDNSMMYAQVEVVAER